MPKILELVGKANVIGIERHGNQTLVIYDGKGFLPIDIFVIDSH